MEIFNPTDIIGGFLIDLVKSLNALNNILLKNYTKNAELLNELVNELQ